MGEVVNVLLVSARFPPELDAEALQVAKILDALACQRGIVIDAVTSGAGAWGHQETVNGVRQLVQVGGRLGRAQRALVRLLCPWLMRRPDPFFLFARQWRRALPKLHRRPDLVYSRAFPLSSTLAARDLARHFEVPWILHLSDPWCECALNAYDRSAWHRAQEADCLRQADCIAFTSATTLERYARRYPELETRMTLHPNVYLVDQIRHDRWRRGERMRVVHTGSLTSGRSCAPLLDALGRLHSDHPMFQRLELLFAGPVDALNADQFRRAPDWLKHVGTVSPTEAVELQRSADMLLVIDHRFGNAEDAQHLLSKLTDYLPHRRRVLALADPGGVNDRFMRTHGLGDCLAHTDIDGIRAALEHAWSAWQRAESDYFERPEPDPGYSADAVAAKLAADMRRLVGQPT